MLCKPEGHVIWTRNRREPDYAPTFRAKFIETGFRELDFISPGENGRKIAVGINQFMGEPQPLRKGVTLFTFTK